MESEHTWYLVYTLVFIVMGRLSRAWEEDALVSSIIYIAVKKYCCFSRSCTSVCCCVILRSKY